MRTTRLFAFSRSAIFVVAPSSFVRTNRRRPICYRSSCKLTVGFRVPRTAVQTSESLLTALESAEQMYQQQHNILICCWRRVVSKIVNLKLYSRRLCSVVASSNRLSLQSRSALVEPFSLGAWTRTVDCKSWLFHRQKSFRISRADRRLFICY